VLESRALVARLRVRLQIDPEITPEELLGGAKRAIQVFAERRDERGLGKAWELLAWAPWFRCRAAAAEEALERAITYARRAGDARTEAQSLNLLVGAALFGPMHVADAIRLCEEIRERPAEQQRIRASALRALAGLRAMEGRFDEARSAVAQHKTILQELGLSVTAAWAAETYGTVEMLAGDPVAAERELRSGFESLERMGETGLATLAALLAQALYEQGEYEEAVRFTDISEEGAAREASSSRFQREAVRGKALARLGDFELAERLARDAVALAERTDFLVLHGDALMALADVLRLAGRPGEAVPFVEEALRLYEQKGSVVSAGSAGSFLAELGAAGAISPS
jgi:ATP/maltotriose-dependent transcriptional regulator MalT